MGFPLYAAQKDRSVWYEILSEKHFKEWKRLGPPKYPLKDTYLRSEVMATDYSTYVYIADLIKSVQEGDLVLVTHAELLEATEN